MFCAPELIFGGVECVWSRFPVLRAWTLFRQYQGCLVSVSCFPFSDIFSAVPRASGTAFMFYAPEHVFSGMEGVLGLIFMFCAPGLVFGGTEGVWSYFHVLRSRTYFRRYRVRRVPFSCFVPPNSFSAVPRATGPVSIFYASGLVFDGTEGVASRFHVLRSRSRFWRYGGRRVPFSCFARPDSFQVVPRASVPVFMFCSPGLIFDSTEGVGSRFHILRSRTYCRRYRGRRFPFLCSARLDSFSAVPKA
jgi:hypothetical protein